MDTRELHEVDSNIGIVSFGNMVIGIVFVPVCIVGAIVSYHVGNDASAIWRLAVVLCALLGIVAALITLHYIKQVGGHRKMRLLTRLSLVAYTLFGILLLLIPY